MSQLVCVDTTQKGRLCQISIRTWASPPRQVPINRLNPRPAIAAFFLGPVAIVLDIIAFFLKNRKKGMASAGAILGIISLIVAGIMTAAIAAGLKAVDESLNAEHTASTS